MKNLLVAVCLLSAVAQAESRYTTFNTNQIKQCSIRYAHEPSFNICLKGSVSSGDVEKAKTMSVRAALTWLRVMKTLDKTVTRQVSLTCTKPHFTVTMRSGNGRSFASPAVATLYMGEAYGTWTHEMGHAVMGLGDTYQGSIAGNCGSQPKSLMCWGAYGPRANPEKWSTLWPDDIAGAKVNYAKVFPGAHEIPDWANQINLEGPLDVSNPWPEARIDYVDHQLDVFDGPATLVE